MKIAVVTPYGEAYSDDRLFDVNACAIGQNLLLPGIRLKEALEQLGHEYHTADMYPHVEEVDVWIFQDLNNSSRLTIHSAKDWAKYLLKRKWNTDYLYKISKINNKKAILIMQEPQTVFPQAYEFKNHQYFDRVLTWDNRFVDGKKYRPFLYPQVKPETLLEYPYEKKKFLTMICGNKSSTDCSELYSERRRVIEYCEKNHISFDLYGFGWNEKVRPSYRGMVEDKLATLSGYKFSICFENMKSKGGYITEKIFDCFFAGCIPVYYGSDVILDYVPEGTFVDYRKFRDTDELNAYLQNMRQEEYEQMQGRIKVYLASDLYKTNFSVEAYVDRMVNAITRW